MSDLLPECFQTPHKFFGTFRVISKKWKENRKSKHFTTNAEYLLLSSKIKTWLLILGSRRLFYEIPFACLEAKGFNTYITLHFDERSLEVVNV